MLRRQIGVALRAAGATEMESAVGHDPGAGFLGDLDGASEMVWMRVGDEDRMDMARLEAGLLQAVLDRVPGILPRKSRVDDRGALVIDERVHVDVAQARDPNRELHAKDVLRDLGDLLLSIFLFLSLRFCHGRAG